jgi:sirohydrochlorin ferrochelatase
MRIALVDNGSLEPAAHRGLRAAAAALSARTGLPVEAVSWRHSDRIPAAELDGAPAATLLPWMRARLREETREFVFVPFLVSPRGAIASAIRADLGALRRAAGGFAATFTAGLAPAEESLAEIVAARVRETLAARGLARPAVIVVDHGGPARSSAALRDAVAGAVRDRLGAAVAGVAAASMESPAGPDYAFNQPLLAGLLGSPGFGAGEVVIAPLFLAPGRHAGAGGDLEEIAQAAQARIPGLRCHFTGLLGSHPLAISLLARSLRARVPHPPVL